MSKAAHRIRKQRWLVRCDSSATAFELRQRLREDWQELLLPTFERAFDQECGDEEVIHLASINCRLTIAPGEALGDLLPTLLHRELIKEMREILFQRPFLKQKSALWRKAALPQERLETLLRYLRTGSVTWDAMDHGGASLTGELKDTCRAQWPKVQALLRSEQLSVASCFRLLQLLDAHEANRAARGLLEDLPLSEKEPVFEIIAMLLESGGNHLDRFVQLQLTALLVVHAVARREGRREPGVSSSAAHLSSNDRAELNRFISALSPAAAALVQNLRGSSDETEVRETENGKAKQSLRSSPSGVLRGEGAAQPPTVFVSSDEGRESLPRMPTPALPTRSRAVRPVNPNPSAEPNSPAGRTTGNSRSRAGDAILLSTGTGADASIAKSSEVATDFPLMVSHAGLILLHPFLPQLFARVAITPEAEPGLAAFVLPRASALLHFLVTGQNTIFEYDIALIKVLLGIEPETPLCVSEGLVAEADKLEAETLLEAAVAHWPALKGTSSAGFRTSFLQRSALLRTDDDGWQLQVERKPFDMLLEHLPWSIGVVKLPWMTRPLYCEW